MKSLALRTAWSIPPPLPEEAVFELHQVPHLHGALTVPGLAQGLSR